MPPDWLDALKTGNREIVSQFLDSTPELVNARTDAGTSCVLTAVYHRHPEIAAYLVSRGADLDLFDAAALGDLARVRLLTTPENVNTLAPDGFSALSLACYFRQFSVARYLLEQGAAVELAAANPMQIRPIHAAAAARDVAIVQLLLEHGADPNARQQQGYGPLHSAAQNGQHDLVELLIAAGADPSAAADDGKTPADLAQAAGDESLMQLLRAVRATHT
jgi:ankyrin repeat protein